MVRESERTAPYSKIWLKLFSALPENSRDNLGCVFRFLLAGRIKTT
jgi:hypothetical protein